MENHCNPAGQNEAPRLEDIIIKVSPDLYRAYHRCTWVIVNETGKDQLEIMEEMVRDFLAKHGC